MTATTGTKVDARDGKVYRTVKIGSAWWSAENLAWAGAGYDYNNDPAYRTLYGRYYDFGDYTPNPTLAGLTPAGTHCPSVAEWWALIDASGETRFTEEYVAVEQFTTSRLRTTDLWKPYPYDESPFTPGLDVYGLSLVPSGRGSYGPSWTDFGRVAIFWASDAQSSYSNYFCQFTPMWGVLNSYRATNNPMSIRFIVDEGNIPDVYKHFACFNGALRGTATIEETAPWGVISTIYKNCVIRMGNVLVALEQYTGTKILLSLDGGLTWNEQTVPDREGRQLSSAARIGNLICIAGEGGMVLVSTDAGITWTGYGDGSTSYAYFRDMAAIGQYFVALDINRGVMRSTDGAVWTLANALSVGASSAQICTDGTTLVVANDKVWYSIDQGVTWVEVPGSSEASGWTVARGWDGFHTEAAVMRGFSADGVSWTFETSTGDIKRTAPGMQSSGPLYVATRWSAGGLAVSSGDGAWVELFAGGHFPSFHQNSLALEYLPRPTKTWVGQAGSWKLADVSVGVGGAWKPSQVSVGTDCAWL